ncbi:MAG: adenosylcobinamide-GDP ribazoletransferase [Bacteroidaceae bacterium]|nr:adenosylcobinamide-GDP ribazoletransferase [Bacteroidaceae bacterium]
MLKRILASLMFFTRIPLWRLVTVEKGYFERVVPLWPLAGWLTGGVMAVVCWGAMAIGLPPSVSVILALASRVLLTGALHEDGFADFCDGFGGGTSRERTLAIMKDSHIGTYGVLGLVIYYLLLFAILTHLLEYGLSPLVFIVADTACKWISSTIIYFLPYARPESEAKNLLIYERTPWGERFLSLILGLAPACLFIYLCQLSIVNCQLSTVNCQLSTFALSLLPAAIVAAALFLLMRRRIGGYTGDCCGATFILTELVFYLFLLIYINA